MESKVCCEEWARPRKSVPPEARARMDLFSALSWSPNHFAVLYLMFMAVLVLVLVLVAAIIPIHPG